MDIDTSFYIKTKYEWMDVVPDDILYNLFNTDASHKPHKALDIIIKKTQLDKGLTSLRKFFYDSYWCSDRTNFNSPVNHWDTSNITDMSYLFEYTQLFNQPLDKWNTSNVTDMEGMFYIAKSFNQDISVFDVSNVTNMSSMFDNAIMFNQNINSWNVSNVKDMTQMFFCADSFDQDLPNWNLSSLENTSSIRNMFGGCPITLDRLLSWGWAKQRPDIDWVHAFNDNDDFWETVDTF